MLTIRLQRRIGSIRVLLPSRLGQEHSTHVSDFEKRNMQGKTLQLKDGQEVKWQLLIDFLPASIARRLLSHADNIIADKYDDITILFTGIKGFTIRASKLNPAELAACLNTM